MPSPRNYDPVKAFYSNVSKSDSCWTKGGFRDRDGYAYFTYKGTQYRAHRWVWTYFVGQIPSGLFVCHKCDNPPCVRLDHLFLGTHSDNMKDCVKKGRHTALKLMNSRKMCRNKLHKWIKGQKHCKQCRKKTQRDWYLKSKKESI